MGGMSVGSVSVRAREKQQEGLMMPPMRLIDRGKLRRDVWRMILNMTRQPQMVGLDLRGFIASNVVARERLGELIAHYGADTVLTVMEELIRYSERRTRERLRQLPDAEVRTRGFLDHDGTEKPCLPNGCATHQRRRSVTHRHVRFIAPVDRLYQLRRR